MIYKIQKNNLKANSQKGNTLIEAMVSLTILSFGLLGIAGLLLASAGQQKNSQSYGVATLLVNDITERMRANKADLARSTDNYIIPAVSTYQEALANTIKVSKEAHAPTTSGSGSGSGSSNDDDHHNDGNNNNQGSSSSNSTTTPTPSASTNCNKLGEKCTEPGSLAKSDVESWLIRLNTELPGGAGIINQLDKDDITSRQVVIMWDDKATSNAEKNATSTDTVNCPTNVITSTTPNTVRCITVAFRP